MGGGSFGFAGAGGFDSTAQRNDIAITYIPIEDLDKALAENKIPAETVIPLRLIVVNFTIPLKKQLEEVKRAMRFKTIDEARQYTVYDGFEVKRRITQVRPTGEIVVIQDWAKYNYEDKYADLIHARKKHDHFEGSDKSKQGLYLPYFYRYEDSLVMPLPALVPELSTYPPIRLKSITDTIDQLDAARTPKVDPSELLRRLQKSGSRKELFKSTTAGDTGSEAIFGKGNSPSFEPGKLGAPPKGPNEGGKGGNIENQPQVNIDHLLGRFVDCDVQPGLSYEYQIQLRMSNPNYNTPQYVSNPIDAKKPTLFSKWIPLPGSNMVPTEDYLFAYDRSQYYNEIAETYKGQTGLLKALQVKDNQAVVQAVKWMEELRLEGKHEPIGGWVVADMPVSRGDYIGKKTFIKLPLWSSENNAYVLREFSKLTVVKGKEQVVPKGFEVDFSSKSILVDFEGGKVSTRLANGRTLPTEDTGTELLIVRPDGKLAVRRTTDDSADPTRKELTGIWENWVKMVESRPVGSTSDPKNPFDRGDKVK